jgi:type II secretory pathway pseudopilin PulG
MSRLHQHLHRLRDERGIALITATIILLIVIMLSLALLSFADNQQHASSREQAHEVAFSLAEAALNAQVSKLAAQWSTAQEWSGTAPTNCTPSAGPTYPTGCVCNNTSTFAGCPSPTGTWQSNYTTTGSTRCPPGSHPDSWGAPATSSWSNVNNGWTTYVRDNSGSVGSLFNSSAAQNLAPYDLNGDGAVWVRAVASYHCQSAVVISKVAEQLVPLNFPKYAVTANAISTSNQGNKIILDTSGASGNFGGAQNPNGNNFGKIGTRCTSITSNCANYRKGAQVYPDTCAPSPSPPNGCTLYSSTPSTTLSWSDLQALKAEAMAYGTYYSPSTSCPTTASQLTSVPIPGGVAPVFVDTGCPSMTFTSNAVINSPTAPGFLVLTNQSLTLLGTVQYYGLIYGANLCPNAGSPPYVTCSTNSVIVTVQGNATVQGAINVDGGGSISFGSSATNFIFDSRVFADLLNFGGADAAPNSFRQLPNSQ